MRNTFPYIHSFVNKPHHYTDISQCITIPKGIDIFTYSFPCQDLSTQGKQKGLKKGTKSSLLYEIERILKSNINNLPKVLLMENVSNLASKRFIRKLNGWTQKLKKLGYKNDFKILKASDFGSAQTRKRLFLVSWLDKSKELIWPSPIKEKISIEHILDSEATGFDECEKLIKLNRTDFKATFNGIIKSNLLNYSNFISENQIYSCKGLGPTLTASGANSRLKIYFPDTNKIRFMNEIECGVYMGFNDQQITELRDNFFFTKRKLIFLLGNSIPIQLLENVFKSIIFSLLK